MQVGAQNLNSTSLRLAFALSALLLVACGGDSPSGPSAAANIVAANIVSAGGGNFTLCNSVGCVGFNVPLRNTGAGCASEVRGTVTVMTGQQQPVGTWQWVVSTTMRPGETVVATANPSQTSAITSNAQVTSYTVSPSWTNVRC